MATDLLWLFPEPFPQFPGVLFPVNLPGGKRGLLQALGIHRF
jgi:hypothetical protein